MQLTFFKAELEYSDIEQVLESNKYNAGVVTTILAGILASKGILSPNIHKYKIKDGEISISYSAKSEEEVTIFVRISSVNTQSLGITHYYHYCRFPNSHSTHRYEVLASLEGFAAMTEIWREAEYIVHYENEYPK